MRGIVIPIEGQHDPREVAHLVDRMSLGGVEIYRADAPFEIDDKHYAAGSFVIPMSQVFARYAKDLLEPQTYPEVRRSPDSAVEPPYDMTAWSLGMQLGVDVQFVRTPLPESLRMTRVNGRPHMPGKVSGTGSYFTFDYTGPDTAIAINRLLKAGAQVAFDPPTTSADGAEADGPGTRARVAVSGASREIVDTLSRELGLWVAAGTEPRQPGVSPTMRIQAPRIGMYAPWTGGNIDEGWTRWVLEQYDFEVTALHNEDIRDRTAAPAVRRGDPARSAAAGNHRRLRFSQRAAGIPRRHRRGRRRQPRSVRRGRGHARRPRRGVQSRARSAAGAGPGSAPQSQARSAFGARRHPPNPGRHHPSGRLRHGARNLSASTTTARFSRSRGSRANRSTVVARYPSRNILASGWLKGEELMIGRAAVVSVDMRPGRVILFGLRPQHRAQTHATFPMLFNALYLSTVRDAATKTSN